MAEFDFNLDNVKEEDNKAQETPQTTEDNFFDSSNEFTETEECENDTLNDKNQMQDAQQQVQPPSGVRYTSVVEVEVEISEEKAPIIILFGPKASGKTMTLVRLARYLHNKQQGRYTVQPKKDFRKGEDIIYKEFCDSFEKLLNSANPAMGTRNLEFMLLQVSDKYGNAICQLLEAPGELYFDPRNPKAEFSKFLNKINNAPNRKLWLVFLEPDWEDEPIRNAYVERIRVLKTRKNHRDEIVFIGNKVDKTNFVIANDKVNSVGFRNMLSSLQGGGQYKGLFNTFREDRPIIRWFKPYSCDFVPFQTGYYEKASNGKTYFIEGSDEHPKQLWNMILKKIGRKQ